MIDEPRLLEGITRLLAATEKNIRVRCDEDPAVNQPLQERYESARKAGRSGLTFQVWREGEITQAGVAWLLACVFVRFLEDNDLLGEVYLAGPGARTRSAQERRTHWYRANPRGNDRDYLLDIFSELGRLPGLKGLLDRDQNPLWSLGPDGDGAKAILDFFQSTDPDTGVLRHDFTDTAHNTRFLGDLYQNISESARKRYALLQTPDFIVDFILDRTLTPALDEFGLEGFRLIDPACGSGHFLLEAFDRLFRRWASLDGDLTVVVWHTLDCVYGVDLNPYAAAIARFRLLIAALRACGIARLSQAPDWPIHVTAGDSLLFGPGKMVPSLTCLQNEDPEQLRVILQARGYHVVVGNPPYINVQDPELRRLYRGYYKSCSGKYQISVPFTELFFNLAERTGYVGMITSNAFMKRAFGKPLIEEWLPKWDMTHVFDTSGVYLPGHGTPTAILIARNRFPVASTLRVVRGIRGEMTVPDDPATAPVWKEIRAHLEEPGFTGRYISVANAERKGFHRHPWSIGGGGAAELKERLEELAAVRLSNLIDQIGFFGITAADEVMLATSQTFRRAMISPEVFRPLVGGDGIRDWQSSNDQSVLFPYAEQLLPWTICGSMHHWLWRVRTVLGNRATFGQSTYFAEGRPWWAWHQIVLERYHAILKIAYSDVETHNHFILDRGHRAFNRHAPVIKLTSGLGSDVHLRVLGILNSSCTCFWLHQVCYPKGGDQVGKDGARTRRVLWDVYFDLDNTKVSQIPLPAERPLDLASAIQAAADERTALLPAILVAREVPTRASLDAARERSETLLLRMIALQEELDWQVYHLYGLLDESLTRPIDQVPAVRLGARAFEIVMARAMESGELETEWFARHRSTPRTTIPEHWPEPYRVLVQRRLDTIARDRDIALIEQPEYKRRWNLPPWEELEHDALRNWLLDRQEDPRYWPANPPVLTSVVRLADAVRLDAEFLQVAEIYRRRADFDLTELVEELVTRESVPFLPILRYKESGLRKRADWERTWELQRREDAGEQVQIAVPPKYEKDDFLSSDYWRLRGKLDVPKERFVSYSPLARDADRSLVIAWAGYHHGQQ
ncbi:MAG: BREX-2 system adenine-specific DNA-methyltransferase PglX, partial [Acidobacteria bacterium]|nr:BREX-2 system adenine-specific DNA-methyltransferase PglX [Acidobacteriota bacterium]